VDEFNITEPTTNLIPIRQTYFSQEFWRMWDEMMDQHKAAYVLGWIAELENVIRGMGRRIQRLEEAGEDQE
jgi:hypothetical protein